MNNRTLGTIAMICAPALLVEGFLTPGREDPLVIGIASMIFMAGWVCSNTVMRHERLAGTGLWGRAVLGIQLVGLLMAFCFGFFEATGLLPESNPVFVATDLAWPLSMLWMLVVGVTVIVAKRMKGWRRFVPFLCPFWLFIAMGLMAAFGTWGEHIGVAWSAVFWGLLGYALRAEGRSAEEARAGAAPEPAR